MTEPADDFLVYEDPEPTKAVVQRKLRSSIPKEYQVNTDTRVQWLWSQRLATVQSIKMRSTDILDEMAATLVLSAAMSGNLPSIELVLQRLEGGAVTDEEELDRGGMPV